MAIERRAALAAAAVIAILAAWPGCRHAARPNLLLITIDTLRADHCSAYGYPRPTTPRLTSLAAAGVKCDVAYAPMATTGPSHATMFTAKRPRSHGVRKNGMVLPPGHVTLGEILRGEGYETGAVVSSFVVDSRFGLDRGFSSYDDDFTASRPSVQTREWEGRRVEGHFDRRADETADHALAWLRERGYLSSPRGSSRSPFFLWVHFFDPHDPYDPPPAQRRLFEPHAGDANALAQSIDAYDGEIRFVDDEMGRLIDALEAAGHRDDTLVIVAGDHGEGLMQHNHMNHGLMIYEEGVRVPLVFRWPRRLTSRTLPAPVELVDLTPTALDLLGVTRPAAFEGRSLKGALLGTEAADPQRVVLLERRQYEPGMVAGFEVKGPKYGVRRGRWKYIEAPEEGTRELYDLDADPHELQSLFASQPQEAKALSSVLARWLQTTPAAAPGAIPADEVDRIRSLGYVP